MFLAQFNLVVFIFIIIAFLFIAFLRTVIHNIFWHYGFKEFLKKYSIHYAVYSVVFIILGSIFGWLEPSTFLSL